MIDIVRTLKLTKLLTSRKIIVSCLLLADAYLVTTKQPQYTYMHVREWGLYMNMANCSEYSSLGSNWVNKKHSRVITHSMDHVLSWKSSGPSSRWRETNATNPYRTPCLQSCRPNKAIWAHILKAHVHHFLNQFTCRLLVSFFSIYSNWPTTCLA